MVLLAQSTAGASSIAIRDGGFEAYAQGVLSPWHLFGRGGVDASEVVEGEQSAFIGAEERFRTEWVQTIFADFAPGSAFVAKAWVRTRGGDGIASLGARWDGAYPRSYRGLSAADGWQEIELRFEVPNPAPAWIQIVVSGDSEGGLWFDNVSIEPVTPAVDTRRSDWTLGDGRPRFTGLVVDARGTRLERGMSPRVIDSTGSVLYDGHNITHEFLTRNGVVSYVHDLQAAVGHPRLSVDPRFPLRLPLVVRAEDAAGSPRTSVVLGPETAAQVQRALQHYDFFDRFSVVFIVD